MDAKQLFFERYYGFQEYAHLVLEGMTEQQLRESPHPAVNPIAWVLWHTARCEDVGVNRLLAERPQVWEEGEWFSRLRIPDRHFGTGMTKEQVRDLCARVSLSALSTYRATVIEQTIAVVEHLRSDELVRELSRERLRQVFVDEGAGGSAADWLIGAYAGHTLGWLLGHIALTHNYYHIGQAFVTRSMYGVSNPW